MNLSVARPGRHYSHSEIVRVLPTSVAFPLAGLQPTCTNREGEPLRRALGESCFGSKETLVYQAAGESARMKLAAGPKINATGAVPARDEPT